MLRRLVVLRGAGRFARQSRQMAGGSSSAAASGKDLLGKLVSASELPSKKQPKVVAGGAAQSGVGASRPVSASAFQQPSSTPSQSVSPYRALLQSLEKNSNSANGSNSIGGLRNNLSNLGGSNVAARQPTRTAVTTPVSQLLGQGSASVRDSFRRAESLRNNPPPVGQASVGPASAVARRILDNLTAALPSKAATSASVDNEIPEVTDGERRYQQHQERLKHQREKFQRAVPKLPDAPYRRNSMQASAESADSPPATIDNRKASPSARNSFSQTSAVESAEVSRPAPVLDDAGNQILDISELKKRMAEKLSRVKGYAVTAAPNRRDLLKKPSKAAAATKQKGTVVKEVSIPALGLTLRGLAQRLSTRLPDLAKTLKLLGEEIQEENENVLIEADVCELVVLEMGLAVKREESLGGAESAQLAPSLAAAAAVGTSSEIVLAPRAPVVCVMGHVDHGKTTLLDSLRKANVAAGEAGGITQKLSAFGVQVAGRQVVFLDTPGHAAFSKMRSHGAEATDLVVLVVALDDGVRPQTREALRVAQEAKCTILVALNKVDKIADPVERKAARTRVLSQLAEDNLLVEDFGGDVMVVEVSGKTGIGLDQLVESLLLQADVLELKAAVTGQAEATVLDAYMEKGRGVVADILVRWGTLSVGDPIVVDTMYGRVKAMVDDAGNPINTAGPSRPVRLLGLRTVPTAGQELLSVASETKARQISERRTRLQELKAQRQQELKQAGMLAAAAEAAAAQASQNPSEGDSTAPAPVSPKTPHISVLLKADGVGTLQALEQVVKGLGERTSDVTITVSDASVGDITRSDVERAFTVGNALILAFNVGLADSATRACAKELDVSIMRDTVIYRLEDSLRSAMQAQMPKERSLVREGSAKVQKVFQMRDKAGTAVAGLIVNSGFLRTGSANADIVYKITRQTGEIVLDEADGGSAVLKRFKDTVHKVGVVAS